MKIYYEKPSFGKMVGRFFLITSFREGKGFAIASILHVLRILGIHFLYTRLWLLFVRPIWVFLDPNVST